MSCSEATAIHFWGVLRSGTFDSVPGRLIRLRTVMVAAVSGGSQSNKKPGKGLKKVEQK